MNRKWLAAVLAATAGIFAAVPVFAATAVATYEFNGNFAADQAGVPALGGGGSR